MAKLAEELKQAIKRVREGSSSSLDYLRLWVQRPDPVFEIAAEDSADKDASDDSDDDDKAKKKKIEDAQDDNDDNDIGSLLSMLESMRRDLHAIYKVVDAEYLPDLLLQIRAAISSPKAALTATTLYDSEWFRTLAVSDWAKVQVARELLDITKRYLPNEITLWRLIADQDPDILADIHFTTRTSR